MAPLKAPPACIGITLLALGLPWMAACGDEVASTPPEPQLAGVRVIPASLTIDAVGDTVRLQVWAVSDRGTILPGMKFQWASSDTLVTRVDDTGHAISVADGLAQVWAVTDTFTGATVVEVRQRPVSVQVQPSVSPVVPGNGLPLTAEVRDALGSIVPEATILWESSAPEVAVVDEEGRVQALSLGSAIIRARSGDALGEAEVQVVDPEWPHKPEGLHEATDNPWSELAPAGWGHLDRAAESLVVDDDTAPLSPSRVLEFVYPEGFPAAGAEPAVDWVDVDGAQEVFVGMWWKASDAWQGHESGINKILFVWDAAHEASVIFTMLGPPDGPWFIRPFLQGHPDTPTEYLEQNRVPAPVVPGRWYRLEFHLVVGPGSTGVLRWWQDGVPIGEYDNLGLRPEGWGQVELAPTWGGFGETPKTRRDFIRVDHTYVGIRPDPR